MNEPSTLKDVVDSWEITTETACTSALAYMIYPARNPSGMVPCYNIQLFNQQNGSFEADLRIFQVYLAQGEWKDSPIKHLSVGLSYSHARIRHKVPPMRKPDTDESAVWSSVKGESSDWRHLRSNRIPPRQMGHLRLIGQVDQNGTGIWGDESVSIL